MLKISGLACASWAEQKEAAVRIFEASRNICFHFWPLYGIIASNIVSALTRLTIKKSFKSSLDEAFGRFDISRKQPLFTSALFC
jgi:hypothetical protein